MSYSKNRNYSRSKPGRVVSLILAIVVILLVVGLFNGNKKDDYKLQHLKYEYGNVSSSVDIYDPDLIENSTYHLYSNTIVVDGGFKIENKINDSSNIYIYLYDSDGTYVDYKKISKPGTVYFEELFDGISSNGKLIKICIESYQDDFNIDFFEKLDYTSKIKVYTIPATEDTNE